MIERFLASGRMGVYFAVSQEGELAPGDTVTRVSTDPAAITVADVVRLYADREDDVGLLRRADCTPALPAGWRQRLAGASLRRARNRTPYALVRAEKRSHRSRDPLVAR